MPDSNSPRYIHGYSPEEQQRLIAQNEVLAPYIYRWIDLSSSHHVLELGCGVGAQMMVLLNRFKDLRITGVELSPKQIHRANIHLGGFPQFSGRYALCQDDASRFKPSDPLDIDGVLMVWFLEHLANPEEVLHQLKTWLPPTCPVWATEVFHSAFHTFPFRPEINAYWQDTLRSQDDGGGDADVGIRLANLFAAAGFQEISTRPHVFFLDRTRPAERQTMLAYWLELMRSAVHETIASGHTTLDRWQAAEAAMREVMEDPDAVFYYTFIQVQARLGTSK